jgi:23S rRNA (adenine2503-C2)-methyltransferase
VREFDKMMNLPLPFRKKLEEMCTVSSQLEVVAEQVSKVDGTLKRAYRLHDGRVIESVLMRYEDGRNTACISS